MNKKPYVLISLAVLIVYFRSLFFGFTYLDDNVLVMDNLFYLKEFSNIWNAFTKEVFHVLHSSAAYYRPILTISFILDAQFSGESPLFYHLSNILIHTINSCLMYLLLVRLKTKSDVAFVLSLLFAVHPVLSQAVAWIPGRNDSLLFLFFVPAFITFINYLEKKSIKGIFLHSVFVFLTFFTKESGLLLPFFAILYLFTLPDKKKNMISVLPVILIWFFWGLVFFYLRELALINGAVNYSLNYIVSHIFKELPAIFLYLGKIFFPFNLSVLPTLVDSTLVWGIISAVIFAVAIVVWGRKNLIKIAFGLVWFIFLLLPSFVRPSYEYAPDFIEHRIYLPIIGIAIILSQLSFVRKINLTNNIHKLLIIGIFFVFSVITFFHIQVFSDKVLFWKNAVDNSPSSPLAHKNLGAMYYLDQMYDEALVEFEKTVEINPTESMIHNNIGLIYLEKKNFDKAREEFELELDYYPLYDNALFNLGLLEWSTGDKKKAEECWLKTVSVNPDHKSALKSLWILYSEANDHKKANYFYLEAVKRGVRLD